MSDDQLTPAPLVRRAARSGANLLVLGAVLTPLWVFAVPCLLVDANMGLPFVGFSVGSFAALWLLWVLAPPALGALTRQLLRWRLRRQLHKLLRAHGIDPRDRSDARRKIERDFWHHHQRSALVALRQRFAEEPPRLDLLAAAILQLRASSAAIAGAAGVSALFIVLAAVGCYLYTGDVLPGVGLGISIALALTAGVIFLTGWEGLQKQRATAVERQEFVRESRRIATMAELAGGLSLAEHDVDSALRGALSDEVAQPGALSEVDP